MEMDLCWFSTFHLLVHFSSKRSMSLGYENTFVPMWACVSSLTALSSRGCFSHSRSPLSTGGAPAEGAGGSLSKCSLYPPPTLLIQAGDVRPHQEGRHHCSEASCTLLHVAQPHVLLELWPPASQALVSFAQVPRMKLHCRAGPWCSGRGPGRWILFPPTAAFSGGQPVECFPSFLLRSYCPTKLFTQKPFSQPLLWGESKPRDQ